MNGKKLPKLVFVVLSLIIGNQEITNFIEHLEKSDLLIKFLCSL